MTFVHIQECKAAKRFGWEIGLKFENRKNVRIGFTLIELLIVVMIIAILAAIAVPNFLEFQVRAKVARVKSDFRVYKLGLEAYAVDNGIYPPDNGGQMLDLPNTWSRLSTPIAYLSTIPGSPFDEDQTVGLNKQYEYWRGNLDAGTLEHGIYYRITSVGPNQISEYEQACCSNYPNHIAKKTPQFFNGLYDPTNGTVSMGDLMATSQIIY